MALWDDYEGVSFDVVVNSLGQYSIWPSARQRPHGWAAVEFTGSQQACLEEIDRQSKDLRAVAPGGGSTSTDPAAIGVQPPADRSVLRGAVQAVPDTSITALIRARDAARDHLAARCGAEHLTRGELLDTSAAWAAVLADAGCGREVPVALLLPRGLDALIAILAVLDAGGAYVPVSCDDAPERIQSILQDCGAPIVVTTHEYVAAVRSYSGLVLTVSDLRERAARHAAAVAPAPAVGDDLAYVFYTSGTTGEPKGVEGTHRQLINYALWCRNAFAHRPDEVTFLTAPLHFLGSLTTIFTPLLEGWPIVIAPSGATTDDLMTVASGTTGGLLKVTPTHVRMMMARGVPAGGLARQLMIGSEPLVFTRELHQWMSGDPDRVVVNHYGLTETHGCFCHWLTGREEIGSSVPVGTPVDNAEAYLVDRDGELVDVGEVGELLVGGPSIGRGYRNRPGMTAQRWIPHPWGTDGARLLRTGDLARLGHDGVVTVLGRADRQVKIRGHRVEPAALEEALRGLACVKEALVLPRRDDGTVLLDAFLVREDGADLDLLSVRHQLEAKFPPQWIPSRMAVLAEFPVNASGKVDTRALPEARPVTRAAGTAGESDRWTRVDRVVAEAFCDVLKLDDIGLTDNFYDHGGDSLASVEVAARVGHALGRDVPPPSADAATVRSYAQAVAAACSRQ